MVKGEETLMATTFENSTLIAVFADRDQANRAIDNLRQTGFSYDQIRLVTRGTNSFIDSLKSMFSQTTTTTESADDWMRIGVPEQEANNYQSELDGGRSIVLLKSVDNPEQALSIMRQSGAYDITTRLRTTPPTTMAGANNANVQAGTYNPNMQPGTYNPNAQPGTYNPNAQTSNYNADVAQQGTYDPNVTQPQPVNTQTDRNF
jgi:hypothetical protein